MALRHFVPFVALVVRDHYEPREKTDGGLGQTYALCPVPPNDPGPDGIPRLSDCLAGFSEAGLWRSLSEIQRTLRPVVTAEPFDPRSREVLVFENTLPDDIAGILIVIHFIVWPLVIAGLIGLLRNVSTEIRPPGSGGS